MSSAKFTKFPNQNNKDTLRNESYIQEDNDDDQSYQMNQAQYLALNKKDFN